MSTVEAANVLSTTSSRSRKTSSMNSIHETSREHDNSPINRHDEMLDNRTDFVSLRKKSADDLLNVASGEPLVLSQALSFPNGSILQSMSPASSSSSAAFSLPASAARRSPSPQSLPNAVGIPNVVHNVPAMTLLLATEAAKKPDPASSTSATTNPMAAAATSATATTPQHSVWQIGDGSDEDQHDAVTSAISTTSMHATTLVASSVPTASVSAGINAITTSAASESESTPLAVGVTAAVGIPVKTKVSDRAKKKAWYSVLYPSYKSRSEDFKKLFKGVPDDERLVVDYSCAVQRDILVHGRLYVSQNYLCFYANIFRWETCLSIRWKDVTAITKEKTALVIPNAILVSTVGEKYFITSFAARDKAYMMLFRVWQNALMDKPMQPQEMWQWVHSCYGDELGLTSDDEDYIDPYENRTDPDEPTAAGGSKKSAKSSKKHIAAAPGGDSVSEDLSEPQSDTALTRSFSTPPKGYNGRSKSTAVGKQIVAPSLSAQSSPKAAKRRSASPSVALPCIGAGAAAVAVASSANSNTNSNTSAKPPLAHRKPISKPNARKQRIGSDSSAAVVGDAAASTSNANGSPASAVANSAAAAATAAADDIEQLPTDMSDSSDSESGTTAPPFVCTAECTSMHEGRQLVHTILPINVDTLFVLLFSKSKFLVDFHDHRKTTNMVHEDWQTGADGRPCRKVQLTVALTQAVGPKCSHVTEHQSQRECTDPGQLYSIDINSTNAGIPYADSFSVVMHYCLVRTVDDHTMFSVHAQVKYKKSVWGVVKGFIEKNTWAGLEDFYTALLRALQSEYCIPPAKAKGRRPRGRSGAAAAAAGRLQSGGDGSMLGTVGSTTGGVAAVKGATFAMCSGASAASMAADVAAAAAAKCASGGVGGVGGVDAMGAAYVGMMDATGGSVCVGGDAMFEAHGRSDAYGRNAGKSGGVFGRWSCTTLMLLVVGALVMVNVILYLNLWRLQSENVGSRFGSGFGDGPTAEYFDFRLLKNSPNSPQEWIELLKKQEALHASETNKWQTILQTAVQLLRKTEQTLSDLLALIDMKDFPTPQQYSATMTSSEDDVAAAATASGETIGGKFDEL